MSAWNRNPAASNRPLSTWAAIRADADFLQGGSWRRLARGLPKKESFFTVQRDAMDVDELKSPALYFGTTTGQLWVGRDGGEEWSRLFDSLPPIHCVKVAVV